MVKTKHANAVFFISACTLIINVNFVYILEPGSLSVFSIMICFFEGFFFWSLKEKLYVTTFGGY